MKSRFIAIEGPDGAGKSTQIELLTNHFLQQGIETKFIHFPRLQEGYFGNLIARFLRGEFGQTHEVHPQLVALLFAEDRKAFAPTLQQWLNEGACVLVDRYVLSNIAFQCAKTKDSSEKKALREWIYQFEFEYNQIPRPDISIYLNVPFSFTHQSLQDNRSGEDRTYLQGKDDIHEKDIPLQRLVKEEYEALLKSDATFKSIVCADENDQMRSKEEIHQDILTCIQSVF